MRSRLLRRAGAARSEACTGATCFELGCNGIAAQAFNLRSRHARVTGLRGIDVQPAIRVGAFTGWRHAAPEMSSG